jgi:hypothetical protein
MATLIKDIADYLEDKSIGTVGTDLFVGYLPPTPASAMAVIDTGGTTPDPYIPHKSPTFQVLIRSDTFTAGKTKLDSVRTELHQLDNVTLQTDQTFVYYILAISEGGHIGRDESGRDLFSINFKTLTR